MNKYNTVSKTLHFIYRRFQPTVVQYAVMLILCVIAFVSCNKEMNDTVSDLYKEDTTVNYFAKAQHCYFEANNDSAMIYLNKAMEVVDTNNYKNVTDIYILQSTLFANLAQFEESMEFARKALKISEEYRLFGNHALALLAIGKVHYLMYNDEKAEEYMLQAKTLAEKCKLHKELMKITGALGELYNVVGRGEEALPLLNQTLHIAQQLSDTVSMVQSLRTLGSYYINLNRGEKKAHEIEKKYQVTAKNYLDEALNLALIINAPRLINETKFSLVRWCRTEENFAKALEYAQEILKDTDPTNHTVLIQIYDHLVTIYACLGDAENSIKSHEIFYKMMLKQSDEKLHRALQEMDVKYKTAEKELQIVSQQAEISHHKTLRFIYIGGLIAAGILLSLLFYIIRLSTKRNRELAEMNATKDKFFSIISHDLKNPAIAQRNALKLLLNNSEKWDKETITKFYIELLKSANSQVSLLYSLLNWAQVQTGRMPFLPIPFNLSSALQPDIVLIQNMAEEKEITFDIRIPENAIVTGDDNMLTIVIRNLLMNAVKFTNRGGTVTLNISPYTNKAQLENAAYHIFVSDTGTGMTPEQIQNLYKIGKKRSQTGTAGEQGSGLGLIVCKELLEKHNTILHIESEENKGSRFWFEI